MLKNAVEGPVLGDPLHRGFLPHLVDSHQIVAGLPHQCGNIGVFVGRHAIAFLNGRRCVPLQFRHTTRIGIEDSDTVVDELERVSVSGDHQHIKACLASRVSEGCQDVISLVILFRQCHHTHGRESLLK